MRRLVVPDETYGLLGDESAELARLDDERKRRLAHESERSKSAYGDMRISSSNVAGGAIGAALLLFLICAAAFGVMTALEWSSDKRAHPAYAGTPSAESLVSLQERRIMALATRVTELEIRTQRTADAAAGSDELPGPAVTSTPSYNGPLSRAVSPPDGIPTRAPERDGVGGRTRGAR